MNIIIVSGQSGSGKSIALNALEDESYYCIDNLPVGLLKSVIVNLTESSSLTLDDVAVGVDARSGYEDLNGLDEVVQELRAGGHEVTLIYLQARDSVLIKRYNETRRKHPLTHGGMSLIDAVQHEKTILSEVAIHADLQVDTTKLNVHDLSLLIKERVHPQSQRSASLSVVVQSFGFKHGVPLDSDFVFDVRCLPNPHWDVQLRAHTGLEQPVIDFLQDHEDVREMYLDLVTFFERWIPRFMASNRSYVSISVGCTGGRHRSVYLVEQLGRHLQTHFDDAVRVQHREL